MRASGGGVGRLVVDTPYLENLVASIPGPPIIVDPWIEPVG